MTSKQQKAFELVILRGFLNRTGILASPVEGDFEAPDMVIDLSGQRVGVEITEIQKSRDERAFRAPKDELVARTRRQYDIYGATPIHVIFSFNLATDFRTVRRNQLSIPIASLLQAHPPIDTKEVVILSGAQLPVELRPWLQELRFWKAESSPIWQISEASWVAPLTYEILQERVDAKARHLSNYRKKGYAEVWLLICAHPTNPACRFDPAPDFDPAAIASPFDRTFFYDGWHTFELCKPMH